MVVRVPLKNKFVGYREMFTKRLPWTRLRSVHVILLYVVCLTHLALSRSDLVWFRAPVWLDAELLVENDVNPAAAAAAALAAEVGAAAGIEDACTDAGKTTEPPEVLLAAGPPATTPPARTCTVTGKGPEVRTAL